MTNRKYHWAIQVVPSMHPHAWRAHAGGYYAQACGRRKKSAVGYPAERFVAKSQRNPDWYCKDCARAARLALAKESAPKPEPPKRIPSARCSASGCGSYAISPGNNGRDETSDLDLCDVCYWRKRAQPEPRPIREAPTDGTPVLAYWSEQEYPRMRGLRWGVAKYGSGLVWFNEHNEPLSTPTHFLPLPPSPEVK